jgi:hypothetical protein
VPLSAAGRRALGLPDDDDSFGGSGPTLSATGRRALGMAVDEPSKPEDDDGFNFGAAGKAALDFLGDVAIDLPTAAADTISRKLTGDSYGDFLRKTSPLELGSRVASALTPDFIEERAQRNLEQGRLENPRLAAVERTVKGFKEGLENDPTTVLPFIGGPKIAALYAPLVTRGAGEAVAEAAVEGVAGEGFGSPEFLEKGLSAGLSTGMAGLVASGLRPSPRAAALAGAVPEAIAPEAGLQAELAAARERNAMRRASEEASRPSLGIPDVMVRSELDQALSGAADEIGFQSALEEVRQETAALQMSPRAAELAALAEQAQPLPPAPVRPAPQEPRFAFRARDAGELGVPDKTHSQASLDEADVRRIAPSRSEGPQEIVRFDLNKLSPEDYEIIERPDAPAWVRLRKPLDETAVEKLGDLTDIDRAAASKAELLPEPQRQAVHMIADSALTDPSTVQQISERLGMSPEAVIKGAEDIKADGMRELQPEAVAIKRATLQALEPEGPNPDLTQPVFDPDKTLPVAAAPEPAQVGAIAEGPGATDLPLDSTATQGSPSNLTPEAAAPQKVSQLPIPGKTKLPTVQSPDPKGPVVEPNLGISERSASLIADQARMLQESGLDEFPLFRRDVQKTIASNRPIRVEERAPVPARRSGKLTELPHDEFGSPVIPGQEDWSPERRAAVRGAAQMYAQEARDIGLGEKPRQARPIMGPSQGSAASNAFLGMSPGVTSALKNTPLEGLGSPKQILAALKKDKGNALERRVMEAVDGDIRAEELEAGLRENAPDAVEPAGDVDTSFDFGEKAIFDGDAALSRLKERGKKVNDLGSAAAEGIGAVRDLTTYGASLIENGIRDFPAWSKEMTAKLGETFKDLGQHLKAIYDSAVALTKRAFDSSEVGAVGKDITPLVEAEKARKVKPIPDRPESTARGQAQSVDAQVPKVEKREIDYDTAKQYTDEDFANKIAKGEEFSLGERDALDDRVVSALDRKDAATTALAEARASGGDVGKANAEYLDAALDYATSVGFLTKNEMAAKRALAAKAKLKEHGPQTPDKFVKDVFRQIPGVSNKQAAVLLEVFEKRPEQLGDALRAAMKPGAFRKFLEYWKAGLLSGPSTHVANLVGNTLEQGIRAVETAVSAGMDLTLPPGKRERFIGELGHELVGASHGFRPAMKSALHKLYEAAALKAEKVDLGGGKLDSHVGAIGGKTGRAVRIPFRALEAADEFFKVMFGEAELYKQAYRKAAKELGGKGKISERAASIIKEARSDSGQHIDIIQAVAQSKLDRTYQQDPGALAQGVMTLANRVPVLELLAPFKKTPANVIRTTIGRSPAGFVNAFKKVQEFRQGKASRGEALDAIARPLVGTAVMAGFAAYARQGGMVGGDPQNERRAIPGFQPYSFVFDRPDGSKVYLPFNRFEPIATLLGVVADMNEATQAKDVDDLFSKGLASVSENIFEKSYLKGLSDAVDVRSDPDRYLAQYVANMTGSLIPNVIARGAKAADPVLRDVRPEEKGLAGLPDRIAKTVQSRIPGLSDSLPARKTGTGEDIKKHGSALSRFASPVQMSTEEPGADLERLMVDLKVKQGAPGREITIPHSKGKKIRLEDDEYERLVQADQKATEELRKRTRHAAFKRLDTEEQADYIKSFYQRAGSSATRRLWADRSLRRRATEQVRMASR